MAKIIKEAKAKQPITCKCCGCIYEFEKGDQVEVTTTYVYGEGIVSSKMLDCPTCGRSNTIEFVIESNSETN